jgi:hypothetical protein
MPAEGDFRACMTGAHDSLDAGSMGWGVKASRHLGIEAESH